MPTATELLAELAGAFALLTRLPVGGRAAAPARCVWAYPLAGAAVGALGAAVASSGLARPLAALLAIAAMLLVTGALHEDGLADTADGLFGAATAERRLAIMRDSRIGSFGALALLLGVGIRAAAIAALPATALFGALIAAASLGRAAMLVVLLLLRPARPDGLGASLATLRAGTAGAGLALGGGIALLALPWRPAFAATALAAFFAAVLAGLAQRRIGGYTGDVLGATSVVAECAVLTLLSSGFS